MNQKVSASVKVWNTCGYVRLSREDGDKEESNSVTGQKDLIRDYLSRHLELQECGMRVDDGYTGSNFERPAFDRLLSDVKARKIDCIVVKDLSRFGRNYKETGNYLERIFPFMDVRFVAVNDQFDTRTAERSSDGFLAPLKNIINEVYSRDISRKSGSALAIKQKHGEFIGAWAAYGYRKCADDPHRIEPDEETAPVVWDIFQWRISGMSYVQIARRLNERSIPSPSRYLYLKGYVKTERYDNTKWYLQAIRTMLCNEKYYGAVLSQKTYVSDFMLHKRTKNLGKVRQVYNDSHHPAIISKEIFDLAQQERERRARCASGLNPDRSKYTARYPFSKHLYCAHCGDTLKRLWRTNGIVWQCRHKLHGETVCTAHDVHNTVVEKCFVDVYNMVAADNQAFFDHFIRAVVNRTKQREQKNDVSKLDKQIKKLESQIDELVMMKSRREIDGEFYARNYQALKEQLIDLQEKRAAFANTQLLAFNQKSKLEEIKCVIYSHETPLTEFDGDLFSALVEKVIVHSPVDLTFVLYGGMEYRMDGSK